MGLAVILSLAAAAAYGVSDFLGATAATRLRVIPTTVLSYAAATVTLAVLVLATGGIWSSAVVIFGGIAGVTALIGFVCFYAAMAIGPMNLASPLIAVLGAAVPVAAAVAFGERLSPWAWLGVVLALASAVLISSRPGEGGRRLTARAALLSIVAGVSLGSAVIALDRAPLESESLAAFFEIVVGLALLGLIVLLARASAPLALGLSNLGGAHTVAGGRRRNVVAALVAGILLAVANAALLAALQSGSLAVVSVLAGLYPLATLVLVRFVGGERMTRLQLIGAALAISATVVLGLSLAA